MKDLNKIIRAALSEEDSKLFESVSAEQSMYGEMFEVMKGKYRWVAIFWSLFTIPLFVFCVYAAIQFYQTPDIREMLLWGGGCLLSFMLTFNIKCWLWNQINRQALSREIKLLALQVTFLAKELKQVQQ